MHRLPAISGVPLRGSWPSFQEKFMRIAPIMFALMLPPTLALATAPALAATEATPAVNELQDVVVTATRTEQPRALTGTSISVLTATDLAVGPTLLVSDALQQTPGLTIVRNGGVGQTTSLGLRGALAGQTLVLIDGVRINDPGAPDGAAILADLLVDNLERIEVLRGPQSTLYGSDAIGGVVNLLSRRGGQTPLDFSASVEGGSLDSYRGNLAANGSAGAVDYGLAGNYYRTRGVSAADARNGNSEDDGYRNAGATGNLRWHLADALSIDVRGYYSDARTHFDGYPPPSYTFQDTPEYGSDKLLAFYTGFNAELLGGRWQNRFAFSGVASDRQNFDPTLSPSEEFYARGNSRLLEYQGVLDFSHAGQLTFGAETHRTTLSTASPNPFDADPAPITGATRINGYYAQYQRTLWQGLTLTGGARHDQDSHFGGHTSLKFAGAWQLFDGATLLRANYGDAFKAPSLYELYSPYSNPEKTLAPESARGWEAGVEQRLLAGRVRASLSYFERRTRDQIDFFDCFGSGSPACSVRPFGYYDNIDRSRAQGLEAELALQLLEQLSLTANFTHLKAIDLVTRNELARRPRAQAQLRLDWRFAARWSVGAAASYTGARFDDQFESIPLPGYTLLNVHASCAVTRSLRVYARVDNLLDKVYEPVAGYGALPRTLALGLRLTL
jgi:vitamin B12 transporter